MQELTDEMRAFLRVVAETAWRRFDKLN